MRIHWALDIDLDMPFLKHQDVRDNADQPLAVHHSFHSLCDIKASEGACVLSTSSFSLSNL